MPVQARIQAPSRSPGRRFGGLAVVSLIVLALHGLGGCASAPTAPATSAALFDDAFVGPAREDVDASQAMALSPALRAFVQSRLGRGPGEPHDARRRLLQALDQADGLRLQYEDSHTRTAAEAFAERRGNCLSLALLTAAVARELGIGYQFQQVAIDELWSRLNGYTFVSGHVNVVLLPRAAPLRSWQALDLSWTVDFVPTDALAGRPRQRLDEARVVAMYLSNRGAEALAAGDPRAAYHWLREALRTDPGYAAAYNTLGVVWQRLGDPVRASAAYGESLRLDPDNVKVLANWLPLLQAGGDARLAEQVSARLARLASRTPLYWYDQGLAARAEGRLALAVEHFERELRRDDRSHLVHHALAETLVQLGRHDDARRHWQAAARQSTRDDDVARYGAKLRKLATLGGAAATP